MQYKPEYETAARMLPEFYTEAAPISITVPDVALQVRAQTYRNMQAQWKTRHQATVYQADGVNSKLDTSYRKTDMFLAAVYAGEFAELTLAVQDAARQFGLKNVQPLHPWWLAGYGLGGKFDEHCDLALRQVGGMYKVVEPRALTALYYINSQGDDVWGFEGGDLEFPGLLPKRIYKPVGGQLIVFPSHWGYSHLVTEITKGYRMVATNFFSKNH